MNTKASAGESRSPVFPVPKNQDGALHISEAPRPHENTNASTVAGATLSQQQIEGASSTAGPDATAPLPQSGAPACSAPPAIPLYAPTPQPFNPSHSDKIFALACFALGFLYIRWMFWSGMQGFGVTVFSVAFVVAVSLYARSKRIKPSGESIFWMVILLLCATSYSLWPAGQLEAYKALLMFGSVFCWCATLFGVQMQNKTTNLLPLDIFSLCFIVPFCNFGTAIKSLHTPVKNTKQKSEQVRKALAVVAGFAICVPLLAVVVPLLMQADSGYFTAIFEELFAYLNLHIFEDFTDGDWFSVLLQLMMGVPVALYLFGLVAGAAHRRYTDRISAEKTLQHAQRAQLLPQRTVMVVFGVVIVVYILFIGSQIPYFFSAFAGVRPSEDIVYSAYAREGFFELCRVASINLGLMAAAHLLVKKQTANTRLLRLSNITLAVVTLLVLATAASKMQLYIAQYGYTQSRVISCVAMVFLAGVCVASMVVQWRKFSIVRFAALFGAALLCLLCICNLDYLVVQGNVNRYMQGRTAEVDIQHIAQSGPAALGPALQLYEQLGQADAAQKVALAGVIYEIGYYTEYHAGTASDDVASRRARQVQQSFAQSNVISEKDRPAI